MKREYEAGASGAAPTISGAPSAGYPRGQEATSVAQVTLRISYSGTVVSKALGALSTANVFEPHRNLQWGDQLGIALPVSWIEGDTAAYIGRFRIRSDGQIAIALASHAAGNPVGPGPHLKAATRSGMVLELLAPGVTTLTVNGIVPDDEVDPHVWTPSNASDVTAFFNAVRTTVTKATVLGPFWFHMVTEAIVTVIEEAGLTLSDDSEQFKDALVQLIGQRQVPAGGATFSGFLRYADSVTLPAGDDSKKLATTEWVLDNAIHTVNVVRETVGSGNKVTNVQLAAGTPVNGVLTLTLTVTFGTDQT